MVSAVPLTRVVEIVAVPLDPCWSERLVGFAPIEKSFGGAVTVRVTAVVCVALVPVPAMVAVYVPGGVVPAVAFVGSGLLPAATADGVRDGVAAGGSPPARRVA